MQVACSVLSSRQAMVIGPTPPGTGVIAPATSLASAKATSPTMRDLPPARRNAVDADVDHGRARLDPVAAHHLRLAHGGDQHIGAPAHRRQIARSWNGRWSPSRSPPAAIAPPACRRCWSGRSPPPPARRATLHGLRQHDAAERRAGHQARQAAREPAGIERMEAVHVLGRIDGRDDLVRVDVLAAAAIAPGCR